MTYIGIPPADQPLVEVLVDDHWYHGELRAWRREGTGPWEGHVLWTESIGARRLWWFAEDRIRRVEE